MSVASVVDEHRNVDIAQLLVEDSLVDFGTLVASLGHVEGDDSRFDLLAEPLTDLLQGFRRGVQFFKVA
eukprot:CAMPEP_0185588744 /NCGR_PEP_ID=MMETSP0434-20130131/54314_1 /TAXON_ID=626734 ORGANISM="Favella taraikaensis, Strain Fe Narragansett Bay" /NCGR_SAMPLE_ID=MMETSP0434 /ASSEMBLY_ACC=CAM_ASM_000379 /LENGTH=68 /DNA_ID=CAMNT_0028211635 /DNA_START=546 /DNA_END=752 /DNA_ORIENTATION=-